MMPGREGLKRDLQRQKITIPTLKRCFKKLWVNTCTLSTIYLPLEYY